MANKKTPDDFWRMVEMDSANACWLWIGALRPNGYGVTKYQGRRWAAHRLAWVLTNGSIPDGMLVCHRCDTPLCCNPKHLFLGTVRDNMQDMLKKGRDALTGNKSWARRHPELLKRGKAHPANKDRGNWVKRHTKFFSGEVRAHLGESNGRALVTADIVREIRRRWEAGESQTVLGKTFGLKQTSVSSICRRINWKYIE